MITKIWVFENKIGYNSVCIGDYVPDSSTTLGFSGSANLVVTFKFAPDRPLLPW